MSFSFLFRFLCLTALFGALIFKPANSLANPPSGKTTDDIIEINDPITPTLLSNCDSLKVADHFTLEFVGVTYDSIAGTSTWDYTLTWDGIPPELSHFILELCTLITNANLVDVEPGFGSIGFDGSTGLYGIKWDNIEDFPADSAVLFSFTLDQMLAVDNTTFAPKAGINNNLATICGPSLACEISDPCDTNQPPTATCPGNSSVFVCDLDPICIGGFSASDPDNNIATKSVNIGTLSGDTVCFTPVVGNNLIRFIVADSCGSADTCETIVNVTLNSPPVASCPDNIDTTVCTLASICIDGFSVADPDNNIVSVVVTGGTLSGDTVCFTPVAGNNLIRLIVTDSCGLADTCETIVNVTVDNTPPQFVNCPTDFTTQCDAVPAPPANIDGTDNCDPNPVVTFLDPVQVPGSCPQSYTIIRRWEIKDAAGNADTCTQTITVEDTTPPVIVDCPANTTVECDAVPSVPVVTAIDNCDSTVNTATYLGETLTPGACSHSYSLVRKWVAVDSCGNISDTCTQIITVVDTTPPSFVDCPTDLTVQCDAIPAPANPTAVDNCDPNPTVTYLGETINPGNCPYTITRKWEAIDDCGNADTCTQILTVIDNVPPDPNCPADITVECDAVPAPATVTAADNCDPNPTVVYLGEVLTPGVCANSYTLTRSWEVSDICGNADTCTQIITVVDTTPPSFVDCPTDLTVQCDAIPAPANPTAVDNCDPNPTVTYLGETINPGNCPYTITRKWEAIDDCGNADTCIQIITVIDNIAPVISCPANLTFECDNVGSFGFPTATDNCDTNVDIVLAVRDSIPGACPQEYVLNLTYIATDDCGNTDSCSQTITVQDTTPPVISCPADLTFECDNVGSFGFPTATDNCDTNVDIVLAVRDSIPGACPQEYVLNLTYIATDDCGNTDTCIQTITVQDTTPPVISNCPSDLTVECDAVPGPASPGSFIITDNCDSTPSLIYLGETSAPGSCPQSYSLVRKWVAVDACGNTSDTCVQVLTVVDTTPPVIDNCPTEITVQCDSIPAPPTVTATDNCDPGPSVIYLGETINNGSCPYTITRKWVAIDACGNVSDTCVQTITVIDNIPPVADSCPESITVQCNSVPDTAIVTFSDNCDANVDVNFTENTTPGSCPQSYTITRRWIGTDECMNADTCVQTITVIDTTPPVINDCPASVTVQCSAVPGVIHPTNVFDNCDPAPQVTYLGETNTPGSCPQSYSLTRKWVAVDACGNTSDTCVQFLTVVDSTPPVVSDCPASVTVQCNAVPGVTHPTNISDNCDPSPQLNYLGEVITPGSCPSQYTLTRKWIATDACGNRSDTCTQVISVGDTTTLSLGADSTKAFGEVCQPISGSFKLRNASSCSPLYWTVNNVPASQDTTILYSAGYCTDFSQTWTISATDSCGRSDSYSVTITANVNCLPTAQAPSFIPDRAICSLGTPICIPGDGFECMDNDGNATSTLNGQPYTPGDPICFTPNAFGPYTLTLICSDGCASDTDAVVVNIIQGGCATGCGSLTIEKTHNTIQGQYETVDITIDSMPVPIGGFDILVEYDASALSLSQVLPGAFITNCGWEYFTYRMGGCTNCPPNACPSGAVRIIAIAETNNGPDHPSCFQMEPAQLATLIFLVTNDRTFECQYVPIRFIWCDCGDNSFSSVEGDTLYVSQHVYDYYDGVNWTEITNPSSPFPSRFGVNVTCDVELDNDKPAPKHCIDFYNGGIDIVCADSIDDRGDINMNGVSNEVADAVLLGNYFIYGLGVFTVNVQGQIAASDVNADGTVLSVADLVYLIRVVIGDAQPYSKVTIPVNVKFTRSAEGRLSINDNTPIGAAFLMVRGQVEPLLLANQMEMLYNFDGINTRILLWSIDGNYFTGDFLQIDGEILSIEMATSEGNPVALNVIPTEFALHQNYPNPFNPKTVISFTLPIATDYSLLIYNVNGQEVASFRGTAENAGTFEIEWEAGSYASGIYLYKLVAGPHVEIKKMILLK